MDFCPTKYCWHWNGWEMQWAMPLPSSPSSVAGLFQWCACYTTEHLTSAPSYVSYLTRGRSMAIFVSILRFKGTSSERDLLIGSLVSSLTLNSAHNAHRGKMLSPKNCNLANTNSESSGIVLACKLSTKEGKFRAATAHASIFRILRLLPICYRCSKKGAWAFLAPERRKSNLNNSRQFL